MVQLSLATKRFDLPKKNKNNIKLLFFILYLKKDEKILLKFKNFFNYLVIVKTLNYTAKKKS